MSERPERGTENDADGLVETVSRWYHVPVLAGLVAFMLWVRLQAYGVFARREGVALSGVDSWYHWRTINYSVENWPWALSYDVWTGYPSGSYVGQFGTLFDQLIATAALIVGLGDPSQATVYRIALLSIPVMGALVALPTYGIGRRLGGRPGGLIGVALLALFPGTFLRRSTVGSLDHHVGEVLFMSIAVLGMMVALGVAERDKPVYEQFAERDLSGLRRPLAAGALAGVALALYVWTWPSGVILIGIFGVFLAIALTVEYCRGASPDHVAVAGAVALGVAGVCTALLIERWAASATGFGYLQPVLALGVAAGCVFMAWLARFWDARGLPTWGYPAAVLGLIVVVGVVVAVALPDLFGTISTNVRQRLLFGQTGTTLTIAEAQPPDDAAARAFSEYRFAFYTGAVGLLGLLARPLFGREYRTEYLLIAVWALFVTSMAFTQIRFNYYLAVVVAVCNAALIGQLVEWVGLGRVGSLRSIESYQALVVVAVALVLVVPLVVPAAGTTAVAAGAATGPNGDALTWAGSNEWLAENTPEQGQWGGADEELEYYGSYGIPEDGDYEYPAGTYGVLSWWDYGHLITVQGERIPHANPFQQNADTAAAFLTADEDRAELLAEAIPVADGDVTERNDEELAALAEEGSDEEMRYVMIDDEMAAGKFSAIATWGGSSYASYLDQREIDVGDGETATVRGLGEGYNETVLSGMYYDDAAGMEHYRLVHESPETTQFVSVAAQDSDGEWRTVFVNRENTRQLQFQIQQLLDDPNLDIVDVQPFDAREGSAVKTYERVEGATLTGETEPGETVTAELELTAQSSDRTFTYTQETTAGEDGSYELTVPYATSEDLGTEEGYTDSDVVAEGDYEVTAGGETATTAVSETAIYEGETVAVEATGEE